jgi:integrase/recombinase XerD
MNRLDPLVEGYLAYLRDVGRKAPATLRDVRCTFNRGAPVLESIRPGVPIWKRPLEDYLLWLEAMREAGRTASCIHKFVSHMRGLLEYAWRSGRAERNVLDGFSLNDPAPRVEPRSLNLDEARRLVLACGIATPFERRDRLMVLLLYGCGLRTGELCALDIGHIDQERRELTVHKAKNDRPRTVPIPGGVFIELLAYLHERGKRGALFWKQGLRRRFNLNDVGDVVRAAATRAGLQSVTPKALRHSFATHLMDRGVDLGIIASLMGHRSPNETGVYLHALPGRREAAVRTLSLGRAR